MPGTRTRRGSVSLPGPTRRGVAIAAISLVAVFALAFSIVMLATRDEPMREWNARLVSMADDRAASIERWLDDLRADAGMFAGYPTVVSTLGGPSSTPIRFQAEEDRARHLGRILGDGVGHHGRADVWIFGSDARLRAAGRGGVHPARAVTALVDRVLDGDPDDVLAYLAADGTVRIAMAAPVRPGPGGAPLGVAVVETSAADFLFPLLTAQPVPSRTGEVQLVTADSGRIRYITPHRKSGGAVFVAPRMARPGLAAAAALRGIESFELFVDYRGDEVLAVTRRLEAAPWGLIAKVDRAEAFAHRREDVALFAVALFGLLLGGVGVAYGLWKRRVAHIHARLRDREMRFRWHAERAGDLIYRYRLRPSAGLEYVNPAFTTLTGYQPRDHYGDPAFALRIVHPEDRPLLATLIADPEAGLHTPHHLRWIRKDGGVIWLEHRTTPVHDEDGRIVAFEGIAREITESKALERDLTETRDRLQLALSISNQTLFDVDVPRDAILVSGARVRNGGVVPESQVLSLAEALATIHPEDREEIRLYHHALCEGSLESADTEIRVRLPDGQIRWLRWLARVVTRDDRGRALRIIGLHRDVTDQHVAQEGLRASEQRFAALERELRHSQKMEAIGRLAGGIAHDFNNVLTTIRGHGVLALDEIDAESPLRPDLEEIVRDADRGAALTRQLLAFSRKQELHLRPVDLAEVVLGMEAMLHRLIGEDIRLVFDLRGGPCLINADPGQIEQVVLNLVINARDAMPVGGRIAISVLAPEDGGGDVVLRVRDEGNGMDAATIERIFEPFFTTKEAGKGTGLGLSTVYGIVRQSGGDVRVESALGAGTTFTLAFPRLPGAARDVPADVPAACEAAPCPAPPPIEALPAGTTVLLVEDEGAVRELTRRVLAAHGVAVVPAASAEEALTAASDGLRLDVLLCDVLLGGMTGPDLAKRIGTVSPGIRMLFMSGYPEATVRDEHGLPDEALFLEKPFTPAQLIARVMEAAGRVAEA